MHRVHRPTSPD